MRVQGLLAVYSAILPIWLNDDDPGMARTMAALDRRLRRGESAIRGIERFRNGVEHFARAITGKRREEKPSEALMLIPLTMAPRRWKFRPTKRTAAAPSRRRHCKRALRSPVLLQVKVAPVAYGESARLRDRTSEP